MAPNPGEPIPPRTFYGGPHLSRSLVGQHPASAKPSHSSAPLIPSMAALPRVPLTHQTNSQHLMFQTPSSEDSRRSPPRDVSLPHLPHSPPHSKLPPTRATTAPDTDTSNALHSHPSDITPPSQTAAPVSVRKTRAKFSIADIDKLINTVLTINPYMCGRNQIKAKWQQVLTTVQAEGGCIGRDWETICNKMKSLIKMVEVGLMYITDIHVLIYN